MKKRLPVLVFSAVSLFGTQAEAQSRTPASDPTITDNQTNTHTLLENCINESRLQYSPESVNQIRNSLRLILELLRSRNISQDYRNDFVAKIDSLIEDGLDLRDGVIRFLSLSIDAGDISPEIARSIMDLLPSVLSSSIVPAVEDCLER